jgi:RimJ/RimL family protein N-acetyltransferase
MLPDLTTERLVLKAASRDDLDELWSLWAIPDVLLYLFDGVSMTRDEASAHLEEYIKHHDDGQGLWMIRSRSDDTLVGEIGLAPSTDMVELDPLLENEIEFQIALHPDAWGKGYGEEALGCVLEHAFTTLGLPYVMGVADAPNTGSRRLQEKMGFVRQREVVGPLGRLVIYRRDRD